MSGLVLGSTTTGLIAKMLWPGMRAVWEAAYVDLLNTEIRGTSDKASPSSMKPLLPGLVRVASLPGSYDQDGLPTSLSNVSCQRSGEWYE
jgi:hypothetical protein